MNTNQEAERNEEGRAEPGLPPLLSLPPPPRQVPRPVPGRWLVLAPLIAMLGGLFGIIGAFYTELLHGSFLMAFVGAPMIEEALKPSGVYLLLIKWPAVLRSRLYTAFLAALSGIAFALIEDLIYLNIYYPAHSAQLALWRYTVCVAGHALFSFVAGFGINRKLVAAAQGEIKFLSFDKRFFIVAMILHSLYNISMAIFASNLGLSR